MKPNFIVYLIGVSHNNKKKNDEVIGSDVAFDTIDKVNVTLIHHFCHKYIYKTLFARFN